LHVDDAKAGAADEPIEKLFAIGRLTTKKRQRKINGPALAGRRLIGTARTKAGTGLGRDPIQKPVGRGRHPTTGPFHQRKGDRLDEPHSAESPGLFAVGEP
jgi:hypothetical protein